jgi:hypothetical protein
MFFKKLVISEGGVPVLIKLLHHPVSEVRQQVFFPFLHVRKSSACSHSSARAAVRGLIYQPQGVLALGWLAAHNPECRDHLLHHRVVSQLLPIAGNVTELEMAKALSWTFSILCGVTHPRSKLPSWEAVWLIHHPPPCIFPCSNFLTSGLCRMRARGVLVRSEDRPNVASSGQLLVFE